MTIIEITKNLSRFNKMIRMKDGKYDGRIRCDKDLHDTIRDAYGTDEFERLFVYYEEELYDDDNFQSYQDWVNFASAFLPDFFGQYC